MTQETKQALIAERDALLVRVQALNIIVGQPALTGLPAFKTAVETSAAANKSRGTGRKRGRPPGAKNKGARKETAAAVKVAPFNGEVTAGWDDKEVAAPDATAEPVT